jgi:FMN phosphatase YigB (HAD superfamily)
MPMIRAVFFDLDGTLRHNLPSGGEFFADYAAQLGVRAAPEDRLRVVRWEHSYWANSAELKADKQMYAEEKAFWNHYAARQLAALGASDQEVEILAPKVMEYMVASYKPKSVVPQDAMRVLPMLKEGGYTLAVISNREWSYQKELESLGLASFFELAVAGGEIRMWKPEPYIFAHTCERLGIDPGEAAYVGDNYFADVVGARRAGLRPVLYDPRGIFPSAECAIIRSFDELPAILSEQRSNLAAQSGGLQTDAG